MLAKGQPSSTQNTSLHNDGGTSRRHFRQQGSSLHRLELCFHFQPNTRLTASSSLLLRSGFPSIASNRRLKKVYVEKAPLPSDIPQVAEIGATSAALETAAFFIGAHCKEVNEDFMLCKKESADPAHCLKEGRRVTRCAQDL